MPLSTDDAVFCQEVTVTDSYGNKVQLAVYQDKGTNGMFGIDASFIEQEEPETIPSPFNEYIHLKLTGD